MANNRLYIYDPNTNKAVFIAKNDCNGWYVPSYLSNHNILQQTIDRFFEELEFEEGWEDKDETRLQLITEFQLPNDVKLIK